MPVPFNRPRGYAIIALDNPKYPVNVGGAVRAAQCFGAAMVVVGGMSPRYQRSAADVSKAYRHTPLIQVEHVLAAVPLGCTPIAVDLIQGAVSLYSYSHPQQAFYIFGAEDRTLDPRITDACSDSIYVPMEAGCLNLAACVNVVLYDRRSKQHDRWAVVCK